MMEEKYITLDKNNIDMEHICCAFSGNNILSVL